MSAIAAVLATEGILALMIASSLQLQRAPLIGKARVAIHVEAELKSPSINFCKQIERYQGKRQWLL
jgi:hypothetical protein